MNRHTPITFSDKFAKRITRLLRWCADTFFAKRYGHRAIVLETVAAVPGMVSGVFMHFKSLRSLQTGYGPKLREMLAEAENERMHLMTFIQIAQPSKFERILVIFAQFIFIFFYSILYIFFPRTAHRLTGYFEEEAVISYTEYLSLVEDGTIENIPAPQLAIDYWNLDTYAKLRDVIIAIRKDEMHHRDTNHKFADEDFNNNYADDLNNKVPEENK
jgi:ubiquinol oxidase